MENKIDSSFERSILFRVVAIIVCIIIACISFFGLAKSYSSPESKINKETIKYLDEKKTTALELSASATAVSTLITLAPGDDGTPVANKLMDLAGYFLIVVSAIYLEKYLLTILGALTFKWLIPVSMLALAVYFGSKKELFWKIGVKIFIFGLAIYAVIPVSVHVSKMIYSTYQESIDATIDEANDLADESEASKDEDKDSKDSKKSKDSESSFIDKAKDAVNSVKNTLSVTANSVKNMVNKFIDGLAVLIVTTCLIPVLVIVFFIWLVKLVLGSAISSPGAVAMRRGKDK
ncbi:MAG: hypothetical protein PUH49_05505 [Lachnospiraceae bacterium]|nr:hypothetical protein [Lachnospiraceae bacterium]